MMKVQKFQDGLNPELRHAVKTFELTTLSAVAHKAKVIEQSKRDCNAQVDRQSKFLGKKTFSSSSAPSFKGKSVIKSFKKTSGFQSANKRFKTDKKPVFVERLSQRSSDPQCGRCFGLHDVYVCKWVPGACFACGKTGHKVSECKDKVLKPIFCVICKQRGHHQSECKEKPRENGYGNGSSFGKGKATARVFALQQEESPTVDTLAGILLVSARDAFCLVDTGATHTCISEEFMSSCGLNAVLLSDVSLCVSTPLGSGVVLDKVCKNVDVMLSDVHLPVDMLVLPISDFDVILGMNWLNQYRVVIDCARAVLSFKLDGREFSCSWVRQRPLFMPTFELFVC